MTAVMRVPAESTSLYGILDLEPGAEAPLYRARDIVEKPAAGTAPSTMAVMGRYILEPQILSILEHQTQGAGGEIQLTDALRTFAHHGQLTGFQFQGKRLDCGVKEEWILAHLVLGLERHDLGHGI